MGASTIGILTKGTTVEEIEQAINEKYQCIEIYSNTPDVVRMFFRDGEDNRQLFIMYGNSSESDYGISGVYLSLGMWGNSVNIIRFLCEKFGGYLDENDCDDEGFYPINFSKYQKGKDITKIDLFKNKIISKVGYDNLKKVLELCEEYKTLTI